MGQDRGNEPDRNAGRQVGSAEIPGATIDGLRIPDGSTWRDVKVRFVDGETISVMAGDGTRRYLFSELHMQDGRTKRPNRQWVLLREFARHNGTVKIENIGVCGNKQKLKERLVSFLKQTFRLPGEPIALTADKGWQTAFEVTESGYDSSNADLD